MANAATYTATGSKATKNTSLPKDIFTDIPKSHQLIHSVYVATRSNHRLGSAKTKNRAKVSGGGRKPWRQKGTGNARAGTIRSPLWRGGGITFGPTGNQNHTRSINKNSKRKALRQSLSLKADAKKILVVEEVKADGTVKSVRTLMKKLPVSGSVLVVVDDITTELQRSTNNIPNLNVTQATYLNVIKVMDADYIVITKKGLDVLRGHLGEVA